MARVRANYKNLLYFFLGILIILLVTLVYIYLGEDKYDWLYIQHQRRKHMLESCNKYTNFKEDYNKLFILLAEKNLVACLNAKVSSTNWRVEFAYQAKQIRDPLESKVDLNYVRNHTPNNVYEILKPNMTTEDVEEFKQLTYFTTVRHPYSRIVSAYKQKFVDKTDSSFKKAGHLEEVNNRFGDHSFQSFVRYILYTEQQGTMNGHWMKYSERCMVCRHPLDYILKLETFDNDLKGLEEVTGIKFRTFNRKSTKLTERLKNKSKGEGKTAQQYMDQLPQNLREKLYMVYKPDFDIFDYNPNQLE